MGIIIMTILNFYFLLFISIVFSLSINSNFLIWMSLELNMLRFLPIISSKLSIELENSIKYFLVQSWASIIFLLRFFFLTYINRIYILIIIRIFIKLGVAPFHVWFISILKTSSLYILILLSSVQKIIPLIIMRNIKIRFFTLLIFLLINTAFIFIILPGTVRLNKILALSSINNIAWIIISIIISIKLFVLFILVYIYLLRGFMILYKTYSINMFIQINSMRFLDKFMIIILFISLGGLPPLLGFLTKFLIIKFILYNINIIFLLVIIFSSLYLLYFYLSRIYFFLTYIPSLKLNFKLSFFFLKKTLYLISLITINILFVLI